MIDDYDKAMDLLRKMEAQLPISAKPTSAYVRAMREQGVKVKRTQLLKIRSLVYIGDEGGILCDVTPSREAKQVRLVSLTHLEVNPHHALAREIRAYQRTRTNKLKEQGPSEPSSFTVRPRKKRRR
jgi:hypothetical protein